jgi:hypothetical protein
MDFFAWLPQRKDLVTIQDRLYCDLNEALSLALKGVVGIMDDNQFMDHWNRIVVAMTGVRAHIVIDLRQFETGGNNAENFEVFLRDILKVAKAKVIVITPTNTTMMVTSCAHNKREASVTVDPLDFRSSTLLFGWHSRFVTKRSQPAVRTPTEFASNLLSPLASSEAPNSSPQQLEELYRRMGMGIPSRIHSTATDMSEQEFSSLMQWGAWS